MGKIVMNIFLTLIIIGILYMIGFVGFNIDPAPMNYWRAFSIFLIYSLLSLGFKIPVFKLASNRLESESILMKLNTEVLLHILLALVLPLTGDVLA